MKKVNYFAILIMLPFILLACKKKETAHNLLVSGLASQLEGYKVENGILDFENIEAFNAFNNKIYQLSEPDRLAFERSIGFVSYTTKLSTILDEYSILNENSKNMRELEMFREKYKHLVSIDDSTYDARLSLNYGHIINEYGYLKIEGSLLYYGSDFKLQAFDGQKETIIKALANENYEDGKVSRYETFKGDKSAARGGYASGSGYTHSHSDHANCGKNHQTDKHESKAYADYGVFYRDQTLTNTWASMSLVVEVKTYKRGFLGAWGSYSRTVNFDGTWEGASGAIGVYHPFNFSLSSSIYQRYGYIEQNFIGYGVWPGSWFDAHQGSIGGTGTVQVPCKSIPILLN